VKTALDTNIVSSLLSKGPQTQIVVVRLGRCREVGPLLISAIVYAELLAYPGLSEGVLNHVLEQTDIQVDFDLRKVVWVEAGRRFARYASRRRKSMHEGPKRLLADFAIGAHAVYEADRLMTFDPTRFKQDFPDLRLYSDFRQ
jgi:predicted nucleic acid-binding protein